MEEAYLMESKAYGCVDEANAYAKALGLKKRFSIYTRNENENSKQQFLKTKSSFNDLLTAQKALQQSTTHHGPGTGTGTGGPGITTTLTQEFYHQNITNIMKGCSNRLEKMCVEVMGIPGEPTQLISLDKFYLEHHKLQLEIRQRRNLMNKTERQLNITIENNEINKNKNENILRRAQTVAILPSGTGGEGGTAAPITGINPNDILLLQQKQTLSKKKESKKDENKKQITEEKLLKILEDTKEVTKILEDQLKELKLRGWNENVL